jgi:hypothetical protein
MLVIPKWLLPIMQLVQEKALRNPSVIGFGVFDVVPYLCTVDDIEFGISHGLGKFSPITFYVNKNLFGDKCAVVLFRKDAKDPMDFKDSSDIPKGRAFFEAPSQREEIAQYIWQYYVDRREKDNMPRFKLANN